MHETFVYDDLDRSTAYTDTRGSTWRHSYDVFNNLAKKVHPATGWQQTTRYNSHGELIAQSIFDGVNTDIETRYIRLADGRPVALERTGQGATLTTFDNQGQPVFSRDSEGNMHVKTWHAPSRISTQATLRIAPDGDYLTVGSVTQHDLNFQPLESATFGHGTLRRQQSWERDSLGRTRRHINADGISNYVDAYALTGWPLIQARETDAGEDRTFFAYNRRGQSISTIDPTNQKTQNRYNLFGDLESTWKPHFDGPSDSFSYDHLGRLDTRTRAHRADRPTESIRYEYDHRGDPVRERWLKPGPPLTGDPILIERTFDALGRLTASVDHNLGLVVLDIGLDADELRVDREFTCDLVGRPRSESIAYGGQWLDLYSEYRVHPTRGTWQHMVHYPHMLNTSVTHDFDTHDFDNQGRLSRIHGYVDVEPIDVDLHWQGDLYAGRTQHWRTGADPLRELAAFDDLGQRTLWAYTAVDVASTPQNAPWADTYCGGTWTEDCNRPLFHQDVVRDTLGRVASLAWQFGHPAALGTDAADGITTAHKEHWRGYTYDKRSALKAVWSHEAAEGYGLDDTDLRALPHRIDEQAVESVGQAYLSAGSRIYDYVREDKIGSLRAIRNRHDTSDVPWQTTPRNLGHQLDEVLVDHATYAVAHDYSGAITSGPELDFAYDPYGRLIAAFDYTGALVEAYAHSADARLASPTRATR